MKKMIWSFILALLTLMGLLIYCKIIFKEASYNILLSLLFFGLWYFYYKKKSVDDIRRKRYVLGLSVLLSVMLSVGSIVSSYLFAGASGIFGIKNIIYCLISIVGLSILLDSILEMVVSILPKMRIYSDHEPWKLKQGLIVFGIIMVGYLLYFVRFYPAIMTPDSYYVVHYANNFILSDFHSFGHTWFVGIFLHLGKYTHKRSTKQNIPP